MAENRELVWLTDSDLLYLANCETLSDEARAYCNDALMRQSSQVNGCSAEESAIVAMVAKNVAQYGGMRAHWGRIARCPLCDKDGGHVPFKSGPRKGLPNPKRPLSYQGVIATIGRFLVIHRDVACADCMPRVQEVLRKHFTEQPHACAEALTGEKPRWQVCDLKECTECEWAGHEGEMVRRRAVLGNGWYPAECPKCGAANEWLQKAKVKSRGGFQLVPVEQKEGE